MPTLFTDPRSGGVKKSSGVNVLPIIAETWAEVRDNTNDISYLIATYDNNSKTDITLHAKGTGGIPSASLNFPNDTPIFGGARLASGRFASFVYSNGDNISVMLKGRASMHKNGVLNVLEGCDCEIEVWENMKEDDVGKSKDDIGIDIDIGSGRVVGGKMETQIFLGGSTMQEESELDSTLDNRKETLHNSAAVAAAADDNISDVVDESGFIEYARLKTIADHASLRVLGINPTQKELALANDEFEEVFGMHKESFASLPGWKKTRLKKQAMLF